MKDGVSCSVVSDESAPISSDYRSHVTIPDVSAIIDHLHRKEDDWSDLMFIVPMDSNFKSVHEHEQVESLIRYGLGSTILNSDDLDKQIKSIYTTLHHGERKSTYKIPVSELILCSNSNFEFIRSLFLSNLLDNGHLLFSYLRIRDLPSNVDQNVSFNYQAGQNGDPFELKVQVRLPLERTIKISDGEDILNELNELDLEEEDEDEK